MSSLQHSTVHQAWATHGLEPSPNQVKTRLNVMPWGLVEVKTSHQDLSMSLPAILWRESIKQHLGGLRPPRPPRPPEYWGAFAPQTP